MKNVLLFLTKTLYKKTYNKQKIINRITVCTTDWIFENYLNYGIIILKIYIYIIK